MSKFFDETLRVRNGEVPTLVPESVTVSDAIESPLDQKESIGEFVECEEVQRPKLAISLSSLLLEKFKGSKSLDAAQEAYRSLRTRLLRMRQERELGSVVITSAVQGEGKTLTALNLAMCCAQLHDMSILLIDADIRTRGMSRLLGSPSGPGLCEVITGESELDQAVYATDVPNLSFLGTGSATALPTEILASKRFQENISRCSQKFKLVLVDSPPILNLADVELITAACDGILMVVRAQGTQREVLSKSASQLDSKKLLGAVYNASESLQKQYKYTYGGS